MSERTLELRADPGRPSAWTLLAGGFAQSHVDLGDPRHLEFEYVRRIGHVIDLAAPEGRPLRVLHLGAGALTLARYVAATRPGSPQLAVDRDKELVDLVRSRLPLDQPGRRSNRPGRIRIRVGDARDVLAQASAATFDLVIADLFDGGQTAAHLVSAEFTAAAARALALGGVYAANVGDGPPLAHARARVATTMAVFPRACLIAEPGVLRGRRFGNLVLAASRHDLPVAGLARRAATDPFPARVVAGEDLARFAAGACPITDESASPSPAPPPGLFARPIRSARAARAAGPGADPGERPAGGRASTRPSS